MRGDVVEFGACALDHRGEVVTMSRWWGWVQRITPHGLVVVGPFDHPMRAVESARPTVDELRLMQLAATVWGDRLVTCRLTRVLNLRVMAANDRVEPTFGGEYALLAVGGAIVGVGVVTWLGAKLAALFSGGTVGGGLGEWLVAASRLARGRSPAASWGDNAARLPGAAVYWLCTLIILVLVAGAVAGGRPCVASGRAGPNDSHAVRTRDRRTRGATTRCCATHRDVGRASDGPDAARPDGWS